MRSPVALMKNSSPPRGFHRGNAPPCADTWTFPDCASGNGLTYTSYRPLSAEE